MRAGKNPRRTDFLDPGAADFPNGGQPNGAPCQLRQAEIGRGRFAGKRIDPAEHLGRAEA